MLFLRGKRCVGIARIFILSGGERYERQAVLFVLLRLVEIGLRNTDVQRQLSSRRQKSFVPPSRPSKQQNVPSSAIRATVGFVACFNASAMSSPPTGSPPAGIYL